MRGEEGPHIAQHQRPAESHTGTIRAYKNLNAFKVYLSLSVDI